MDSIKAVLLHNGIVMSFHHRVTQSFTEFNQFEIKRIELRETLCYSVVKTHYFSVLLLSAPRKNIVFRQIYPLLYLLVMRISS